MLVLRLVTSGTVEERVVGVSADKAALADRSITGGGWWERGAGWHAGRQGSMQGGMQGRLNWRRNRQLGTHCVSSGAACAND